MTFLEEVAAQLVRLSYAGGLPILITLALLVGAALALVAVRRLPPPRPPAPEPQDRPDAVWGTHDDPDDRPPG